MNENINLTKILGHFPKGTKFYSSIFGEVEVTICNDDKDYPIVLFDTTIKKNIETRLCRLTKYGKYSTQFDGECILFPSKDQRDWSKVKYDDKGTSVKLPKTWEEFCEQNEIKKGECLIDDYDYIKEILADKRYGTIDKNVLPNKQAAEAHLAYIQLHQLRNCYRQGWVPTIDKVSFGIVGKVGGRLDIDRFMYSSRFLTFQSREIAEEFLTNFREFIERAGDLI